MSSGRIIVAVLASYRRHVVLMHLSLNPGLLILLQEHRCRPRALPRPFAALRRYHRQTFDVEGGAATGSGDALHSRLEEDSIGALPSPNHVFLRKLGREELLHPENVAGRGRMALGDVKADDPGVADVIGLDQIELVLGEPQLVLVRALGEVGNEDHLARLGETDPRFMCWH